jgi:hypothetical protein
MKDLGEIPNPSYYHKKSQNLGDGGVDTIWHSFRCHNGRQPGRQSREMVLQRPFPKVFTTTYLRSSKPQAMGNVLIIESDTTNRHVQILNDDD